MKHILATIGLILCVGCLTPQQQEWTCDRAQEAYLAYQAAEAAGIVSDKETIAAVKVAAAYLSAYCGWQPATVTVASKSATVTKPTSDRNGVLMLKP